MRKLISAVLFLNSTKQSQTEHDDFLKNLKLCPTVGCHLQRDEQQPVIAPLPQAAVSSLGLAHFILKV